MPPLSLGVSNHLDAFFPAAIKTKFLAFSLVLFGCSGCLYFLRHVARFEVDLCRHWLSHRRNCLLCPLGPRTGKSIHAQRCRTGHGETTRSIRAKGRFRDAESAPGGLSKAPEGLSKYRRTTIKWGTTRFESRIMTILYIRDA